MLSGPEQTEISSALHALLSTSEMVSWTARVQQGRSIHCKNGQNLKAKGTYAW